jgi:predicted dehydrogenase
MIQKKKMNRRQFVKATGSAIAAAIAVPTIIPSKVFAQKGENSPNNKIVIGCIGMGGMGTGNMRSFLELSGAKVVAVCDVDDNHLARAKSMVDNTYGNKDCSSYKDFREVIARDDIDAIMHATPDQWHAIVATQAARAGKDVYGEKPLAYTISEGRAIIDAVRQYGRVWQTGSWQRSQRHFRFACELVRNGRIGKIHTVRVGLPAGNGIKEGSTQPCDPPPGFDYDMWLGPAPWRPYNPARCHWNFRWIMDYSGGQLTDWAGHHIDIANWGMGTEHTAPVSIEGVAEFPPAADGLFNTPPRYRFECEYKEGFKMVVADSQQTPMGMGTQFIGDKGWVYVSRGGRIEANPKSLLSSVIGPGEIHLYESDNHHQNFLDCVRSRKDTITPAEAAHHAIMVAHLGMAAMRLGRRLNFDGKTEKYINDPEADRLLVRPMRSPWHL